MKIRKVTPNNRRKTFEVRTHSRTLSYPYAKADPSPSSNDPLEAVRVDAELGREAFTYVLRSGREGTVHVEQVLEFHRDPAYLRELLLYNLTLEARERLEASGIAKREVIRRLGTSATQLYRILDPTCYGKSIDQVLNLLHVLGCDVDITVCEKSA